MMYYYTLYFIIIINNYITFKKDIKIIKYSIIYTYNIFILYYKLLQIKFPSSVII